MCCTPGHVGAPPEWHRESADEGPAPVAPARVTGAALAAWARILRPVDFTAAPRLTSTESGQGRALPARQDPELYHPDLPLSCEFNPTGRRPR
jgi:hypothetical protein